MMNSWTRHGAWRGHSTSQFVAVVVPLGLLDGAGGLRYRGAPDQGLRGYVVWCCPCVRGARNRNAKDSRRMAITGRLLAEV
ncbi:hypothetical protein BC826DRAFT_297342 [Russula brevipes]|nr:hypothetical protein BC826DRAFT_297342 [Russula brevipes]